MQDLGREGSDEERNKENDVNELGQIAEPHLVGIYIFFIYIILKV